MPNFDTSKVKIVASLFVNDRIDGYENVMWRPPILTVTEILKPGYNKIRSPYGGPLIIEVIGQDTTVRKPITAKIYGGTPMTTFVLGKTTAASWAKEMKKQPSWLIIQSEHVIGLDLKSPYAQANFSQMVSVAKRLELMLKNHLLISGYDLKAKNRNSMHAAPQGTWWWVRDPTHGPYRAYASNPVVINEANDNDLTLYKLDSWTMWMFAHEFGHLMQTKCYSWVYGGEVTNNVYAAFSQAYFCGDGKHALACKEDPKDFVAMQNEAATKLAAGKGYLQLYAEGDPWTPLVFWLQITATFGYEPIRKMHRRFREMIVDPNDTVCKDDYSTSGKAAQIDAAYEIMSEMTGTDLTKHWDNYKLPLSDAVRQRVAAKKYAQPKVDVSQVKISVGTPFTWKPSGSQPSYALPPFKKIPEAQRKLPLIEKL
jgi:hypothetical protein